MRPPKLPVPSASRVTFTPERPSVTKSVAVARSAFRGSPLATAPAATPALRKLRLETSLMVPPNP